ncbi:sulfotransferase [Sphingobium sp. Sx8-8]|uniref:sulfotransferase family protein n=1 Tax=Sphingobium sp. Sx8-8 TaxID=2933617 RepID=UPI001F55AF01|nr:sulfotransferase [Sphingobium sp. Sx8-8]
MGELSVDRTLAAAESLTGLHDWGGGGFREGLERLYASIMAEAGIDPDRYPGIEGNLAFVLGNRLRIIEDRKRFPGIAEEKIEKPVFVMGLPRSGTTLLQALLTADPGARGTLHWELLNPSPPPETASYHSDGRITLAEAQVAGISKELLKIHPFDARLPEECGRLFDMEVMNQGTFGTYQVPSYLHWLLAQDFRDAYPWHKKCLQHFQHRHRGTHWVCKSNKHMFTMERLFETYPDLRLVWIHRDPGTTLASLASFIYRARGNLKPDTDPQMLGREWASLQELALQRAMLFRERLPDQRQICDVHYDDVMRDPLGAVERIYAHFAMPFDETTRAAIGGWLKANPQDKHGRHSYGAERFGLDARVLRERFAPYIERYGVNAAF